MTNLSAACRKGMRLLLVLCVASTLLGCGEERTEPERWPAKGRLVGGHDDGKKSRDISGIACSSDGDLPRRCLVIDDEGQSAQAVTVEDGQLIAGAVVPLIEDSFEGHPLELDGEGVAFAEGAFYIIGSHGHPRDRKQMLEADVDQREIQSKVRAASQIVRARVPSSAWADDSGVVDATIERSDKIREAILGSPELAPFADRRLDAGGLTIEGIAVAIGRIYVGFRSPVLDGRLAAVLDVSTAAVFDGAPMDAKVTRLDLGGRGIRDLAVMRGGFVILAGPALDEGGSSAVYRWDGIGDATLIGKLPDLGSAKPEAVLPLSESATSLRVLVLSDGEKEGAPTVFQLDH